MEFKGTKGKWKLANNDYGYYTSVRNLDDTRKICVSRVNNMIESNANMLLLSKAPEMLEMLEKDIKYLEEIAMLIPSELLTEEFRDKWNKEMTSKEQLIKEATEL